MPSEITESLFSRLEKYSLGQKTSRENLFTEIFTYLLQNDAVLRRDFLVLLGGRSLAKRFLKAEVKTQDLITGDSYIDIAFNTPSANLYVESKIDSSEGLRKLGRSWHGQINHYLKKLRLKRSNSVLAYITKCGAPSPGIGKWNQRYFLGHKHWDEVYTLIQKRQNKTALALRPILAHTLAYMKECEMAKPEVLTKKELKQSEIVFTYIRKAKRLMSLVWEGDDGLGAFLANKFGNPRTSFSISQDDENGNLRVAFQSKRWKTNGHMWLYFFIYDDYADFGLGVWSRPAVSNIMNNAAIKAKVKEVMRIGSNWYDEYDDGWWYIGMCLPLKSKDLESLAENLRPRLKEAARKLSASRLIQMVHTRLR